MIFAHVYLNQVKYTRRFDICILGKQENAQVVIICSASVGRRNDTAVFGLVSADKGIEIDSDGTVYRTPDDKLLVPPQQWQLFSQPVAEISQEEEPGKISGLNLEDIVQYGIVFYDRGDTEKAATFFVDDVQGGQGDEQPPPQAGQGASSDSP